jgi:hypothetical protein
MRQTSIKVEVALNGLLRDLADKREDTLELIFRPLGKTGALERRCNGGSGFPRDWIDQAMGYTEGFLGEPQYTCERDAVLAAKSLAEIVVEALVFADMHKQVSRGVKVFMPMEVQDVEQQAVLMLRAAALSMPADGIQHPLRWVIAKTHWGLRHWAAANSRPVHLPRSANRSADLWLEFERMTLEEEEASGARVCAPDVADWMDIYLVFQPLVDFGRRMEDS